MKVAVNFLGTFDSINYGLFHFLLLSTGGVHCINLFYLFSFLFHWFVLFYFLVCMGSEPATE